MSSEQQRNVVAPARISNKLTLDSEQEERRQEEIRKEQEEIQRKKEEKRKRREQAEQAELQKLKLQEEKQKKYEAPEMMFQEDSQDGVEFKRVIKKIKKAYPDHVNRHETQSSKKRNDFIVDDQDDDSQSSDQSDDSGPQQKKEQKMPKKQKKIQKQKKPERREEKKPQKKKVQPQVKKQKIKVQHRSDKKQALVRQVSIRWWYALPEWPPAEFDYNGKLKQLGYRVLNAQRFKLQDEIVNGLAKCVQVDGYKGVYKSRTKLIDVRPKQTAPTLNNFRKMSSQELTNILKKALTVQIQQLKLVKYKQRGEDQLMINLEKKLARLLR